MKKKSPKKFISGVIGGKAFGFGSIGKPASRANLTTGLVTARPVAAIAMENLGMNRNKSSALRKISAACKAAAKRKFKVWPSAYASGWGVRCTKAGGPSRFGGGKKKK